MPEPKPKATEPQKGQTNMLLDDKPTMIDGEAFKAAAKIYAQNVVVQATPEEVCLQFCIRQDATTDDGTAVNVLIPQTVVYMNIAHYRRFLDISNQQMIEVDRAIQEFAEKHNLPLPDELHRRFLDDQKK